MNPTDLKKGTLFTLDGEPYQSIEYRQKVMGRGSSVVTVRGRSLKDGRIIEKTFRGSEDLGYADIAKQNAQYLYADDSTLYFMNEDNYEQIELSREMVGDYASYLKEGSRVIVQFFEGQPITVELPKNVWLQVEYTEPAVKGDTSSSVQKDAKLETGLVIKVPIFIKTGDVISVDTETGAYRERQK
ncbi:elongation factor P [Candidatus Saccharibacteria bacterium]|nr:elongation factor P [Candidatus Saccharibacteria bacterium]MCB9821213.1 elongation factor P [Candidatus Nomurabacteria bacterium]